jgi:predicted dehydrogenase
MTTRFGLLGTGYWGRTVHGPGLVAHPDVELVGLWGRDAGRSAAAATELGTQAFADAADLFAAVDAVAVALPPDVQADLDVDAATAGCHLLLDKPLALTTADARRVVTAVESAGVASVVFFTARFRPELASFWRQVAGGAWTTATVTTLASIFGSDSPYADSAWRKDRGALWDIGPHALATVTAGLGPVDHVTAVAGAGDLVHLTLRHQAGGSSALTLSLTFPEQGRAGSTVFYGPGGVLTQPVAPFRDTEAYAGAIDELLSAASTGDEHPCGVTFAAGVVEVLARAQAQLDA